MDRFLCVAFCMVVMVFAIFILGYCGSNAVEEFFTEPTETTSVVYTTEPESTTEPVPAETTQVETEPPIETTVATEPPVILYDVPLDEDLQLYIIDLCEERSIDPAIVIAMIYRESSFRANAVGDGGNSLGLMQIQPRWNGELMEELGCLDLFDPYQNVTVGIHILAEKIAKYDTIGEALTAYNAGDAGARKHFFSKGIYANSYAKKVLAYAEEIK